MTDTNKDGNGNITKYKLSKGIGYFETFITTLCIFPCELFARPKL